MIAALVVVCGLSLLVNAALFAGAVVVVRRTSARIRDLVTPVADGELSPAAQVAHAMAQDMARAFMLQIKQQIGGTAGAIARQEQAIDRDMTAAALEAEAPQWSALLSLLPKNVQKRVLGNPAAAAALVSMLGKNIGGGGSSGGDGRSSVQARLRGMQ